MKRFQLIFLLGPLVVTQFACVDKHKRSKESPYYKLLAGNEYSVKLRPYSSAVYFGADTLHLTLESKIDSLINLSQSDALNSGHKPTFFFAIIKFDTDGQLEYRLKTSGLGLCGNGLLQLKSGAWWLNENKLILDVTGSYNPEEFHAKTEYGVSIQGGGKMDLVRLKKIISEYKLE